MSQGICGGWRVALTVIVLLLSAGSRASRCQAETYSFNPKAAEVSISYKFGLLTQSARFEDVSGTVDADDKTSKLRHVDAVIKTAGLTAPEPISENTLKGSDFLDVANHPEIRFKSAPMKTAPEDGSVLTGDLTIKGVTHPITLQVHFYGPTVPLPAETDHPDTIKVGPYMTATGQLSRKSFDMTAYQLLVSDEIEIRINAQLERAHVEAPPKRKAKK